MNVILDHRVRGGKSEIMRRKLVAIWRAYNRGEAVPRVLVVGPGWKPTRRK